MAITQAMTTSFKAELMLAVHDFRATSGDSFKLALYTSSATLDANTTSYTASNEVTGTNYSAGGGALVNSGVTATNTNASAGTGSDKTSTAGDFTIIFPSATNTTAIIRIA